MKKLFLLAVVSFMVVTAVNAQTTPASLKRGIKMYKKEGNKMDRRKMETLRKLEGNEVSEQSKQAFEKYFDNITPMSSERLIDFDEFTFAKNGAIKSAFYDTDAKLVGTAQIMTFADLPSKGQEDIRKRYADYAPSNVIFYKDNELNKTDMVFYGLQFEDKDSYFVEMKNGTETIVLQVLKDGEVNFFTKLT